jgi:hypothetical protein
MAALLVVAAGCSGDAGGDLTDPDVTAAINDTTGLYLKPLERVGNGVNTSTVIAVDTATTGNTLTVRTTIRNPTANSGSVDCAITADPTLQATPVGTTTGVTVSANGTATCSYELTTNGVGAFPVTITITPAAGSPVGLSGGAKSTNATLRVLTGGRFGQYDVAAMDLQQRWFNLLGSTAFPAESLSLQNVRISEMSIYVVPTSDVLGTFTLKGTVISGTTTFPSGTVTGTLRRSTSGLNCGDITAGPNARFSGTPAGFPSVIGYFADVCSEPASVNGVAGFQRVSIDYVQSLSNSLMSPGAYLLSGNVQVKVELSFTPQGSTVTDKATATVTIAVPSPTQRSQTNFDGTRALWTQQNTTVPVVTTP